MYSCFFKVFKLRTRIVFKRNSKNQKKTNQSFEAYSLVFCNHEYKYMNELKKTIEKPNPTIKSLLAISCFMDSKKVTPNPITNGWNI